MTLLPPNSDSATPEASTAPSSGTCLCRTCGEIKPFDAFASGRFTQKNTLGVCKSCWNAYVKARRAPSPTPPAGTIAGARVREDRRIKRKYADLMDFSYDLANRFMPAIAAYMEVSALNYRMMRDICEQLGLPAPEPLPDISKLVYTFKHSLTKAMVDLPAVDRQVDGSSYHLQADGSAVISAAMIADAAVADPLATAAPADAKTLRQQDAAPQAAKHPLIDAGDALVAKAQEAAPPLGIPPSTAVDLSDVFDEGAKKRRRALMDDVDSHDTSF